MGTEREKEKQKSEFGIKMNSTMFIKLAMLDLFVERMNQSQRI